MGQLRKEGAADCPEACGERSGTDLPPPLPLPVSLVHHQSGQSMRMAPYRRIEKGGGGPPAERLIKPKAKTAQRAEHSAE